MTSNNSYQLIVFDWDGTIMDSSRKIVNCFNGAAQDYGLEQPDATAVKRLIGLSLSEAFSKLYPRLCESEVSEVVGRYREHWITLDNTPMPLFDGVDQGLTQLNNAGYLLAVATGKSWRGLERALKECDLSDQFVCCRCADQSRAKPHPQMLFDILDYTGLEASQGVMIGDTTFDLQMASNANMDAHGVGYGSHCKDELSTFSQTPVFDGFDQLVEHFI